MAQQLGISRLHTNYESATDRRTWRPWSISAIFGLHLNEFSGEEKEKGPGSKYTDLMCEPEGTYVSWERIAAVAAMGTNRAGLRNAVLKERLVCYECRYYPCEKYQLIDDYVPLSPIDQKADLEKL